MTTKHNIQSTTHAAPLAVFRSLFGLMMLISMIRFWANGWIEKLYLEPTFHFKYFGFEWVSVPGSWTYLIFLICGFSALLVAIGLYYRVAIILFFLSFTYIELLDKTTYLNHYYFISLLSFLMIWLPANAYFSCDNLRKNQTYTKIPSWTIDSVKLLLAIVYFYAGVAKLNSDWLLKATPLKIWLPSKFNFPFIGDTLMQQEWFHYTMSWGGMIYDIAIPFLLFYKRTRILAFALVVFFHVFTRALFPIGMFPYIMIVSCLIFFETKFHLKIISFLKSISQRWYKVKPTQQLELYRMNHERWTLSMITIFMFMQLLFPWRYVLYPGELFWTEEGYRFSWRVMLMEKAGIANFKVVNSDTKEYFFVDNSDFLTSFQEKQMSFQPDFILEYAHYLGKHFKSQGHENIEIYVDCYVTLNGRPSQRFIDPSINLLKEQESFKHKTWILPFNDEIKGL